MAVIPAHDKEESSVDVGTVAGYNRVVVCQEVSGPSLRAMLWGQIALLGTVAVPNCGASRGRSSCACKGA